MSGINAALYIGRDGMVAHQVAINVTGHNIANVNTPGYTRQRVVLETGSVVQTPVGTLGSGVNVSEIQRVMDQFTAKRINQNLMDQGKWEARNQALEQVESVFTETEDYGLNVGLNAFWNAWQDLANNPSGYAERIALTGKGSVLAETLNQEAASLVSIQEDLDASVVDGVSKINDMADKLNSLNRIIYDLQQIGQNPNDLLDQRDSLLNNLSTLIDFTSQETDGKLTVTLGDGNILVGDTPNGKLTTVNDAVTGFKNVVWEADPTTVIHDQITSGNLRGWLDVRDDRIPEYALRLDDLAAALIDEVNTLHSAGIGLDESTGNAFFTGASALDIQVNSDLTDDPNLIAAAGPTATSTQIRADNTQALAITDLQNQDLMGGGSSRLDEWHSVTLSMVGSDVRTAQSNLDYQTDVLTQLQNYRESVSGVSLDEEMVNLIKYQQGFNAASRLIATVDEMMAELMNMVS